MRKSILFLVVLCISAATILDPAIIASHMFENSITGNVESLKPSKLTSRSYGRFPLQTYEIDMVKTSHQFLPEDFPATTVYAYAGHTDKGLLVSVPGPAIVTMKDTPIEIIWTNKITGKHIFAVDVSPPFEVLRQYLDQVPTVPHMHGVENQEYSDGQPFSFWTASGRRGKQFNSLKSNNLRPNQAIYRYFNNVPGLYWYHDHVVGMTRLNMYAGLAGGVYEVIDSNVSTEQRNLIKIYGNLDRKFFAVADKSFQTNGELYYPVEAQNANFTSWIPQFFGNTMTVNGKVWPKVELQNMKYRLVFLNACQSRYLNIYFIDTKTQKRVEFDLIRVDSDYVRKPVTLTEMFHMIASRIEIVIDFRQVKGDLIMRNNAAAPYPYGDPAFMVEEYTGVIMKIQVKREQEKDDDKYQKAKYTPEKPSYYPTPYSSSHASEQAYYPTPYSSSHSSQQTTPIPYSSSHSSEEKEPKTKIIIVFIRTSMLDMITERFYEMKEQPNVQFYTVSYPAPDNLYPSDKIFNTWPFTESAYYKLMHGQEMPNPLNQYRPNIRIGNFIKENQTYPTLSEGTPYFPVLLNTQNALGQTSSIMIDGVSMQLGNRCEGAVFKLGETYDFFIINLTEDEHPMHIHLVSFEPIARYTFDVEAFKRDYLNLNGPLGERGFSKHPKQIDVRPYLTGSEPVSETEKFMSDVVGVPTERVTQVRVKFESRGDFGFPFNPHGTSYVWHCHILEHEDNQMMRWFCIE